MLLKSPCNLVWYITIAQSSIYAFGIRQSLHRNMSRQGTDFQNPLWQSSQPSKTRVPAHPLPGTITSLVATQSTSPWGPKTASSQSIPSVCISITARSGQIGGFRVQEAENTILMPENLGNEPYVYSGKVGTISSLSSLLFSCGHWSWIMCYKLTSVVATTFL